MKIVVAASEMTPYAKTGGLADVAGSLPEELARLGHRMICFLPYYRCVHEGKTVWTPSDLETPIPMGDRRPTARFLEHERPDGVRVVAVRREEYFDRSELYGIPERDYDDNAGRFLFFCKAVLAWLGENGFDPDILHCHDWQTAAIPVLLRYSKEMRERAPNARSVLTIHNLAYQGSFPPEDFEWTNLPASAFSMEGLEFYGRMNLLKGGILWADAVNTVSRRYAREIRTPEYGCGLEEVLASRKDGVHGVLNGIDVEEWNPAADPFLPATYSRRNRRGKAVCRSALLDRFGLTADDRTAVLGIVSRLADQKGFDLLAAAMDDLLKLPIVLAVLGKGDAGYQDLLRRLARRHPGRVGVRIEFSEPLAHLVIAGSDMLLMPSRYEPCGLNQMYGLRYGTIPVVRATGGLDDTVEPFDPRTGRGNGFKFGPYDPEAFLAAVREALGVFGRKSVWSRLVGKAMEGDFSWAASAGEYEKLFRKAAGAGKS